MRKPFAIATMFVFVFTVSSVYACGEKKSSSESSKASYEKTGKVEVTESVTAESRSEKAEVMPVDYSKTAKSACCSSKSKAADAAAMKADVGAGKAECPAAKDCPALHNKDSKVENMKAEKGDLMSDDSKTSISAISSSSE